MSGFGNRNISGLRWSLGGYPFLAAVWEPEGLVLTPRTTAVPYGYGFPKRTLGTLNGSGTERYFTGGEKINPPFGTEIETEDDECLNQVLINRFENNKYLDKFEYIVGLPEESVFVFPAENRRLRELIETEYDQTDYGKIGNRSFVVYWAPFYFPPDENGDSSFWAESEDGVKWIDAPGINNLYSSNYKPIKVEEGVSLYRQFSADENGISNLLSEKAIYENETETWYCHWPEELLYDNDGYEMVFYMTNQYRAEVGRLQLFREIRGHANITRMILAECQRAKVMFHDNEELYRQGYKTVVDRAYNAGSNWVNIGENLAINSQASGFNITSGEIISNAWRNSPPHYENMIDDIWDTPLNSTSHYVMGGFNGIANETEYEGVQDPAISGSLWSQIFVQRDYWVMAGNINQTTRHGSISFFQPTSPIGARTSISEINELSLYFKGRNILINPIVDKIEDGYSIILMGAAICKIADVFYVRVIFQATKTNRNYHVYRRPLFGNHIEDWAEEASQEVGPFIFQYNSTSFDYEGEKAFITHYMVDVYDLADHYLPMASNQYNIMTSSLFVMEYYNGTFSAETTNIGPEITYTVETDTYTIGETEYTYITRYLQKCFNDEGVQVHPFHTYNAERTATELKYLKILYDWEVDQTRTDFAVPVYENSWSITETLVLPSGKEVILKYGSAASNEEKDLMVLSEGSYILIFLYLEPVNEDMVYVKINLRGEDAAVYGQATIYADLYDSQELQVITEFDEVLLDSTALSHANLSCLWVTGDERASTVCDGIISTNVVFQRDSDGYLYPVFRQATTGHAELWKCTSDTSSYRAYGKKPRTGIHHARLDIAFGDLSSCIRTASTPRLMNFTYPANLKIADYTLDGVGCWATRYKDKFVAQIRYNSDSTYKMWNIPFTEENSVWANFDISSLVGIGDLTDIMPFGSIL